MHIKTYLQHICGSPHVRALEHHPFHTYSKKWPCTWVLCAHHPLQGQCVHNLDKECSHIDAATENAGIESGFTWDQISQFGEWLLCCLWNKQYGPWWQIRTSYPRNAQLKCTISLTKFDLRGIQIKSLNNLQKAKTHGIQLHISATASNYMRQY